MEGTPMTFKLPTTSDAFDLPDAQECDHPSGRALRDGHTWQPMTWQERYEREHADNLKLAALASILVDLNRCEHGRHEDDHCSSCGGPSRGNPHMNPDRIIGYGLEATPIKVPRRGEKWGGE